MFDAREGRLEGVRKAMKAADIDFDAQDPEVKSSLSTKCSCLEFSFLIYMLSQTGQTALIAACGCNVPEIVKLLLKKRIRIDTQDRVSASMAYNHRKILHYIDTITFSTV